MRVTVLVLILTGLANGNLLVGPAERVVKYFGSGNEAVQAATAYNLTSRFDPKDYFGDINICIPQDKPLKCSMWVNNYFRKTSILWGPPLQDPLEQYPRKQQDCQYTIEYTGRATTSTVADFSFTIQQHNCTFNTLIKGGAAFEIFAQGDSALGRCRSTDLFDNTYHVSCAFPRLSLAEPAKSCMRLTVLLDYEHFDAYTEAIQDFSDKYPPLRSVLVDNAQFCSDTPPNSDSRVAPTNGANVAMQEGVRIPSHVRWYSGLWVRQPLQLQHNMTDRSTIPFTALHSHSTARSSFRYQYLPDSATATHTYLMYQHLSSAYTPRAGARLTIPALTRQHPHDAGDGYAFQPVLLTDQPPPALGDRLTTTLEGCLQRNLDADLCETLLSSATQGDRAQLAPPEANMSVYDDAAFMRNVTADFFADGNGNTVQPKAFLEQSLDFTRAPLQPDMLYHFVGASHMRYNFDAVCEYYYGTELLKDVPRKHHQMQVGNLRYNFVAHTVDQRWFLTELCESLEQQLRAYTNRSNNNNSNNDNFNTNNGSGNSDNNGNSNNDDRQHAGGPPQHTLVLQTGAWDLTVASVRRLLQDPAAGPGLAALLERILTGHMACGGLRHNVWLTAVPHPVCFADDIPVCNSYRCFRVNGAITAANEFYVRHLLHSAALPRAENASSTHKLQLSIVDAYSIIQPRLVFSENSETACLSHYTCRVSAQNNVNYGDKHANILIQTPGGTAVVKSILNAISL